MGPESPFALCSPVQKYAGGWVALALNCVPLLALPVLSDQSVRLHVSNDVSNSYSIHMILVRRCTPSDCTIGNDRHWQAQWHPEADTL